MNELVQHVGHSAYGAVPGPFAPSPASRSSAPPEPADTEHSLGMWVGASEGKRGRSRASAGRGLTRSKRGGGSFR